MTVAHIGPFQYNAITIDGYKVPYIEAIDRGNGQWTLRLDDRFAIDVTEDEIERWMWWVADAMAIAAGYTSFGENSQPTNLYKSRLIGISLGDVEDDQR